MSDEDVWALSPNMREVAESLERYGTVDHDVLAVLEALADMVDDRNHGRDLGRVRARVEAAVAAIQWR